MSCLLAEPVGPADFCLVPLGPCSLLKMWLCCPQPLNLRFRLLALTPFENKCLFHTPTSLVKWHKQNNLNQAHLFFLLFCRGNLNCLFIFTSLANCWVRSVSEFHSLFLFHSVLLQCNSNSICGSLFQSLNCCVCNPLWCFYILGHFWLKWSVVGRLPLRQGFCPSQWKALGFHWETEPGMGRPTENWRAVDLGVSHLGLWATIQEILTCMLKKNQQMDGAQMPSNPWTFESWILITGL